jgi:hypothetical protein
MLLTLTNKICVPFDVLVSSYQSFLNFRRYLLLY